MPSDGWVELRSAPHHRPGGPRFNHKLLIQDNRAAPLCLKRQHPSILLICEPFLPVPPVTYGGIERVVDILARGLRDRGWKVTLACHPESTCAVETIPLRHESAGWRTRVANAGIILRHLATHRYDIVHSSAHYDLSALLWPLPQKVLHTFHAPPDWGAFSKRCRHIPKRNLWFSTVGHHMVSSFSHIAPTRGIHNGITVGDFSFRDQVDPDAPLVFLGRIEEIKGTHLAIEAAERSGRRLVIAGNRSSNPEIDRYFKEMVEPRLSRQISYVGPVDTVQKAELLGGAAALLMPIGWDEPFGLVMAEALACGTPVLGFNRGALPEIVTDGVTGAACETLDELVDAIGHVERLSRRTCRAEAESRFSEEAMVDQYVEYLSEIFRSHSV